MKSVDWFEIIVLVLIFGGSALAAVSKKLITLFSPKEEEPGKEGPLGGLPTSTPPSARTQAPGRQPRQTVASQPRTLPHLALGELPRRPTRRTATSTPPAQGRQQVPPRPPVARAEVVARPSPKPKRETPMPARVEDRQGGLSASLDEERRHIDTAVGESREHFDPHLAASEGHFMDAIERQMDYTQTEVESTTDASGPKAAGLAVGRTTQRALRRAIVMKEILGPPVALREPEGSGTSRLL